MPNHDHLPSFQDPCTREPFSILRFAVLTLIFLTMLGSGFVLILLLLADKPYDKPYGILLSSVVINTAAVAVYTFSRNRGPNQPFLLSCPVVANFLALLGVTWVFLLLFSYLKQPS